MERIPYNIHESWHEYLQPLFDDNKMKLIRDKVLPQCNFYPEPQNIFRVFSMPLDHIKVVVLGQDPYPNGEAIGYAFAVNGTTPTPKSLQTILKEVELSGATQDLSAKTVVSSKTLEHWVNQGVFLLNTALTVEVRNAGSHTGIWQWFTREVIKIISSKIIDRPIWMLWGAKAQSFKDCISNSFVVDSNLKKALSEPMPIGLTMANLNYILEAPHPAAEAYNGGTGKKFSGCNHFNLCNEILSRSKKSIINW